MTAPTSQQLRVALSKARLSHVERAIIDYIAAWTIDHPDVGVNGVVGASPKVMAAEMGLHHSTIYRALWGLPTRSQRGLVDRGVIRCWRKGGSGAEAVWSIEGDFERWDVEWWPVTRKADPVTRREVLLELSTIGFGALYSAEKPDFFAARLARAKDGRSGTIYMRWARRKGRVFLRAPSRGEADEVSARDSAENVVQFPGGVPSYRDSSNLYLQPKEETGAALIEETPQALAVIEAIRKVTNRTLTDNPAKNLYPRLQVVQAVCDTNDVAPIVAAILSQRPKWWEAVQLVKDMARLGGIVDQRGPACEECGGRGQVEAEEAGRFFMGPCPVCRAAEGEALA